MSSALARVACIIPAKDEQQRIAATVTAARALPWVEVVIVCDDGSADATGEHAAAAGAIVVTHRRNRGKGSALESGVNALGVLEQRDKRPECGTLLLLDADLGESAAGCAPLLRPVVSMLADLTIAVLPAQQTEAGDAPGGFGLVMGTAARGIRELTGWTPQAPLSGQRCLTRKAFELASPLAAGWGVEVGMTVDVLRAGLTVQEVPVALHHRATGHDLAGQLHRAKQLRDVTRALAARGMVQVGLDELRSKGAASLRARRGRGR
ncbi:MAG: Glycosyltransferases involved in cell wall biogenesis [uncultured Friedmanniella sp.]|uniref:Glucosyl-3-phosphoglycerate synthase n=1 Tax=uncultured Friedmanniella sp. TaxID=335381 RepID=A0A6J4JY11_9ACTN|nr:glycosyltransferase [uncultured Friedmanniella sp.]CAA9290436.1 MAG: Glycosyltransferases involved in cell wall biogenesis [uncultured Friedmanniella sp.]